MTTSSSSFITLAIAGVIVMVMMLSDLELMLRRQDSVRLTRPELGRNFLLSPLSLSLSSYSLSLESTYKSRYLLVCRFALSKWLLWREINTHHSVRFSRAYL